MEKLKTNIMKYVLYILSYLIFTCQLSAQNYVLENEDIIFSFQTKNNKFVYLCQDKNEQYIVYRFGTKEKIELEYPKNKDTTSWSKFEFFSYLRGGGIENDAKDLNEISFQNHQIQYTIYQNYYSEGEKYEIGINVLDLETTKTIRIIGSLKTVKGTLIDLRDNERIIKNF
jgi:hypothetical protein